MNKITLEVNFDSIIRHHVKEFFFYLEIGNYSFDYKSFKHFDYEQFINYAVNNGRLLEALSTSLDRHIKASLNKREQFDFEYISGGVVSKWIKKDDRYKIIRKVLKSKIKSIKEKENKAEILRMKRSLESEGYKVCKIK